MKKKPTVYALYRGVGKNAERVIAGSHRVCEVARTEMRKTQPIVKLWIGAVK